MLLLIWFKILVSGQKQIFKQTDTESTEQPDQKHAFFLVVCQSIPANVTGSQLRLRPSCCVQRCENRVIMP